MHNNQQVTLFDNKFVADSLREILKCSSCRYNFTSYYEIHKVTSRIRGNRPVLLPCAHSMCENCIQQNFKNLVCPQCSRPVPIPQKFLEDRRDFTFNTVFNTNFFLIGTLRNLSYNCSENLCDSSALLKSDVSRRVNQTSFNVPKCNECDTSCAAGKCATCPPPNNFLCKPCFAKIHNNSKILKSHRLMNWDKLDTSGLPFLPKPEFCYRHNGKVRDQYCPKCEEIVCFNCAEYKHAKHNFISLERRNTNYIDGIYELLDTVKQSNDQVRKAQMVSKIIIKKQKV